MGRDHPPQQHASTHQRNLLLRDPRILRGKKIKIYFSLPLPHNVILFSSKPKALHQVIYSIKTMASKDSSTQIPFQTTKPLNTPGGLGKEIKGNMQGTNILNRLENNYRGKMTDGKMFEDDRIETNIVGEHSVKKLLKGENIRPVGGTGGDGITKTHEFLKDVDD